jgi:hypothetical protein
VRVSREIHTSNLKVPLLLLELANNGGTLLSIIWLHENETKMKTKILISLGLFFLLEGCRNTPLPIDEVPPEVIETVPCPTLISRIMELFPEHNSVQHDELFGDVQKRIVITKETELYVTYLAEGAGYRNTFGWYHYNENSPPSSASELTLSVMFPDVSKTVLDPGYRLKVGEGTFPAGTVVGFFLIVGGWQEEGTINYDQPKVYTDFQFNPNGTQQHILFREQTCGDIVLAFEDLAIDGATDRDFNDILFTVSDNNSDLVNTSFETTNIVSW